MNQEKWFLSSFWARFVYNNSGKVGNPDFEKSKQTSKKQVFFGNQIDFKNEIKKIINYLSYHLSFLSLHCWPVQILWRMSNLHNMALFRKSCHVLKLGSVPARLSSGTVTSKGQKNSSRQDQDLFQMTALTWEIS